MRLVPLWYHLRMIPFTAAFLHMFCGKDAIFWSYLCRFFCCYSHAIPLWMWPKLKIVIAFRIGLKALFYQQIEQEAFVVSCFPWQPTTYWCETYRCNLQQNGWMLLEVPTSQVHWWILGFWPHFTAFGTNSLTKELLCDRNFFDLFSTLDTCQNSSISRKLQEPANTSTTAASWHQLVFVPLTVCIHPLHPSKGDFAGAI